MVDETLNAGWKYVDFFTNTKLCIGEGSVKITTIYSNSKTEGHYFSLRLRICPYILYTHLKNGMRYIIVLSGEWAYAR